MRRYRSAFGSAGAKTASDGIGLVVLFGLLFAAVSESDASDGMVLEALDRCPVSEPTCVVMQANLRWPGPPSEDIADHPAVQIIDIGQDKDGRPSDLRTVMVSVEGRLNGGARRPYRVRFDYSEGGIYCEDFVVAALGARRDGGGAFLTRQGVFEIESAEIEIGHRSNLALIDLGGSSINFHLSPHWDRGFWDGQAFVSRDRKIHWRNGSTCLDLETHERFQRVDDFSDTETTERLEFDLWRIEGIPFAIYIYGIACT